MLSSGLDMVEQTRIAYFHRIAELDAQLKHLTDRPTHTSEVNNTNCSCSSSSNGSSCCDNT